MSQDFTDDCYASGHQATTDLENMEKNFAALKSSFSGTTAPANTVAGMLWYDTTQKLMKQRDSANSTWFGFMVADSSHKIWVYRNTAPEGWAIDSTVTDCVTALKGGSNAYNANGGTLAGTWTQPGYTLTTADIPAHTHGSANTAHTHTLSSLSISGEPAGLSGAASPFVTGGNGETQTWTSGGAYYRADSANAAHTHTSVGGGGSHNHGTTYRPYAAIGTLQYLDI